ncbi:hypothetical protein AVEN_131329-1 [Araneus ventricosus]|uniref:RNase H type-1 domain-containing protein n=1 Tax=Araneus ventricosus TaxID=182803 RepID=A0A4Y1ZQN9_ARAVE|nr:hypothetical protein AVEN_131329-1 [Araneus ventricosus]
MWFNSLSKNGYSNKLKSLSVSYRLPAVDSFSCQHPRCNEIGDAFLAKAGADDASVPSRTSHLLGAVLCRAKSMNENYLAAPPVVSPLVSGFSTRVAVHQSRSHTRPSKQLLLSLP